MKFKNLRESDLCHGNSWNSVSGWRISHMVYNNDNDKRLGLTAKTDQPDHKKNTYTKNKNGITM